MGVATRVHRGGSAARATVDVALLLNRHLLASRVLLFADAEQAHDAMPETAHDAAGAEEDQEDQADNRANNDASNSARREPTARAASALLFRRGACGGNLRASPRRRAAGDTVGRAVLGRDDLTTASVCRPGPAAAATTTPVSVLGKTNHLIPITLLVGSAADGTACLPAGAGRRNAVSWALGGSCREEGAACAGEGLGLGPGCGEDGVATAGIGSAAGDVVGGVALLAGATAVLVIHAAGHAVARSDEAVAGRIFQIVQGIRVGGSGRRHPCRKDSGDSDRVGEA